MTDYIFEIQCYEKGNLLKEFAEYCGYHLGLYHYYNDHAVVDFLTDEEFNKIIQQPIVLEIYAFTVQPYPLNDNFKNKKICMEIKEKWRKFASSKFPNYQEDMEEFYRGRTSNTL